MSITAATKWPTNAEMIVDIVELGYIRPNDSVIDLTFGGGKWWTLYAHAGLFVANVDPGDDTLQISRRLNGLEVLGIERDFATSATWAASVPTAACSTSSSLTRRT